MADHKVICWDCGAEITDPYENECPRCKGLLTVKMDLEPVKEMKPKDLHKTQLGVWRYAPFMPVDPAHKVPSRKAERPLQDRRDIRGVRRQTVICEFEGLNPTGSFKDRGMTIGVSHAKELEPGRRMRVHRNTSASLAAYASKANMQCAVFPPIGKGSRRKIGSALFFGAKVLSIDGNFDDAWHSREDVR